MGGKDAKSAVDRDYELMTIRTNYPHQDLSVFRAHSDVPAIRLWASYVPLDAEQRTNKSFGILMVRKPKTPLLLGLAWPVIRYFAQSVFEQDRMAVEGEQRAWEEQGADWNAEVSPVLLELRQVLARCGVPIAAQGAKTSARVIGRARLTAPVQREALAEFPVLENVLVVRGVLRRHVEREVFPYRTILFEPHALELEDDLGEFVGRLDPLGQPRHRHRQPDRRGSVEHRHRGSDHEVGMIPAAHRDLGDGEIGAVGARQQRDLHPRRAVVMMTAVARPLPHRRSHAQRRGRGENPVLDRRLAKVDFEHIVNRDEVRPVKGVLDNHLRRNLDGLGEAGKDLVGPLQIVEHLGQLAHLEIADQGEDESAAHKRGILANAVQSLPLAAERDAMAVVRARDGAIHQLSSEAEIGAAMRADGIINVDLPIPSDDKQAAVAHRHRADVALKLILIGN